MNVRFAVIALSLTLMTLGGKVVQAKDDTAALRKDVQAILDQWNKDMFVIVETQDWNMLQTARLTGPNTAVGIVSYDISWDGADPKTGKIHRFTEQGKERDTWVKTRAGWKMKRSGNFDVHILRDGKPSTP